MQAFMLYMSGGGVQIFSMGIVAMLLLSPFKNLSTANTGAYTVFLLLLSLLRSPHVATFFPASSHVSYMSELDGSPPPPDSLRTFCAGPAVIAHGQVLFHAPAAETGLLGVQRPHARARPLEMSVHGLAPDGYGRLVGFREQRTLAGDFVVLGWAGFSHRDIPLFTLKIVVVLIFLYGKHECTDYMNNIHHLACKYMFWCVCFVRDGVCSLCRYPQNRLVTRAPSGSQGWFCRCG